jgi:SOS response regulatory protein OraA/RecX
MIGRRKKVRSRRNTVPRARPMGRKRIDFELARRQIEREEIAKRVPQIPLTREEQMRIHARRKFLREQLRVLEAKEKKRGA